MPEYIKLKKSNCKNCYKCIRHCPVKSIRFSGNQAHIVGEDCIHCGQCFVVCPQNAKEIIDETEKVKVFIKGGEQVIASIAPSFIANYDAVGIEGIQKALKQLGFAVVEETAWGATLVKNEYERILHEEHRNILISSCCSSVNQLITKHFPNQLQYLADVVSPVQAHCMDIKKRYPTAKTVFVGPCIAKKDEAECMGNYVDVVLTFEDLSHWLKEERIELEQFLSEDKMGKTRLFPTTGGILKSMATDESGFTYLAIDGVENCMAALRDIEANKLQKCFIEMSACAGSCIGGPVMEKYHRSPIKDFIAVSHYAGIKDFEISPIPSIQMKKYWEANRKKVEVPTSAEITTIFRQMGKMRIEDELNCGSCGYNTCRDKAIAVIGGKANLSMCMPFLKDKAESFSDNIINNTPNGIIVLNENLEVQQVNRAACKIMNIRSTTDVMGEPVIRILDPDIFMSVYRSGRSVHDQRVYLAEYKKFVEQTVLYDQEYNILICILRDVTDVENEREKKESISRQTIEIADKVVAKQMRIVQEIASLLGETAAETKIALTKLKESIADE